jgi:hypothetical protein
MPSPDAEQMPDKHPDAVKDYAWDWSAWLPSGDAIASYTVEADSGLTVDSTTRTGAVVTAWVSGGTAGTTYGVRCTITTTNSPARVDIREMRIEVRS